MLVVCSLYMVSFTVALERSLIQTGVEGRLEIRN